MNVFNYDRDTFAYIGYSEADIDPIDKGYLIPAHATEIEPLEEKDGYVICFNKEDNKWEYVKIPNIYVYDEITKVYNGKKDPKLINYKLFNIEEYNTEIEPLEEKDGYVICFNKEDNKWEYVINHKNKIVYNIYTKEPSIVDYVGDIKTGYTLLKPNFEDEWKDNEWVPNIDILKKIKLFNIDKLCKEAILSGFKSSILGKDYFYYSTLEEQSNLNTLVLLKNDAFFKCQEVVDKEILERKEVLHTIEQLNNLLLDCNSHIKSQIKKKDNLEKLINSYTTIEELNSINW